MAKKYDVGNKSDIQKLKRDIKSDIKKQISKEKHDITCPSCKAKINITSGKNICPICKKRVDVTIKT